MAGSTARVERRGRVYYAWVKDFARADPKTGRAGKWRWLSTGCTDYKAAQRRAGELERQHATADRPADAPPAPLTFATAVTDFLAACVRRNRSAGTLDCYGKKTRHLRAFFGDDRDVATIRAVDVNAYVDRRLGQAAARSTVQKELVALRGVLIEARDRYPHDVRKTVERFDSDYDPRTRHLTHEEYNALDQFLGTPRRNDGKRRNYANQQAAFRFIVATAARDVEMQRARVGDIDLERGLVLLRTSKTRRRTGKTLRWVPITGIHEAALRAIVEATKGRDGLMFDPWLQIRRDLVWACEKLKIDRVSCNDLRRTHSMWLRKAGVDRGDIAAVLGHKDTRMVDRVYAKLEGEDLRDRVLAQLEGKT